MITPQDLFAKIGRDSWPLVLDVRPPKEMAALPRFLPAARPAGPESPGPLGGISKKTRIVAYGTDGDGRSVEAATRLRKQGFRAEALAGGLKAWIAAGGPTVGPAAARLRQKRQPSRWVTRERPKIDRVACPWLVRRFLDPDAKVFYADPARIPAAARKHRAVPFDIPGEQVFSHEGGRCSFDYFIRHFAIEDAALDELAIIVRGADTGRLDLAFPCAGLAGISLGLSVLFEDDREMLEHGMVVYDALYAWIRHAKAERHNWPKANKGKVA
jgi:rhodanese-related sulfurtransferase